MVRDKLEAKWICCGDMGWVGVWSVYGRVRSGENAGMFFYAFVAYELTAAKGMVVSLVFSK